MAPYAIVPDTSVSRVLGLPLEHEHGIGALSLNAWLETVTQRFADRPAIIQPFADGTSETWSYTDLWERSCEVARALIACGLNKHQRVGILATNRREFISIFMGTLLAGGVAVPLSTFSTASELDHLLRVSDCSILFMEEHVLGKNFAQLLEECEPRIAHSAIGALQSLDYPFLKRIIALDRQQSQGGYQAWEDFLTLSTTITHPQMLARAHSLAPSDPAALFFSSGSTGRPKGMLHAHRALAIQFWRWPHIFALDPNVRIWVANGFFWAAPLSMGLGGALSLGGSVVMLAVFDPEAAVKLIERYRITCPMGWPHQWAQMIATPAFSTADLSSLRYVHPENPISQHPSVQANWQEPTRIYGNSETFTLSTGYKAGTPEEDLKGCHGFPLPGMDFKVVHPFTGALCPMGERGELAIKGATLMLEYIGIPLSETLDEDGYFRTGDGGYVDSEGRVYWEGRLNDIIKTGGANVSPVEVDGVLVQCPQIKFVKTIGVPHPLLGEEVVACIVPHHGETLSEESVRALAKQHLASFKVPRRVLFLQEDEIEQTGSAKMKADALITIAQHRLA